MRTTDATKDIAWFLLANPWSTQANTAHFLGYTRRQVETSLSRREWFEKISVAVDVPNLSKNQAVYALTAKGHRDFIGLYRNMKFTADALSMTYGRLTIARSIVKNSISKDDLHSLISPWRPGRRGSYLDVLMEVSVPLPNRPRLWLAVVLAPKNAQMSWYRKLLEAWSRWQRKTQGANNSVLVIQTSLGFTAQARHYLEESVQHHSLPVLIHSSLRLDWRSLLTAKPLTFTDTDTLLTKQLVPLSKGVMPDRDFISDTRGTKPAHSDTFLDWLSVQNSGYVIGTRHRLDLGFPELRMLTTIGQYPTLSASELGQLPGVFGRSTKLHSIIRSLRLRKLISPLNNVRGRYQCTEEGLEVIAALEGIGPLEMSRSLGYPSNLLFAHQEKHNKAIREFMFEMLGTGMVSDWRMMNASIQFDRVEAPGKKPKSYVRIVPDSVFRVETRSGMTIQAWLEFDRGTRRQPLYIRRQLEKYYLANYAILKPCRIPPIFFLLDNKFGSDDTRFLRILKILKPMVAYEFDRAPIHIYFASWQALKNSRGSILSRRVWLHFHKGDIDDRAISIGDAIEALASEGSDAQPMRSKENSNYAYS